MKCKQCGMTFKPERKSRRFCSNRCKVDARRSQVGLTCTCCGNVFTVSPYRRKQAKFCSAECRVAGLTKDVTDDAKRALWCRFAAVGQSTACWHWRGSIAATGYGLARLGRHFQVSAHRLAYELFVGPIPAGAVVCHRCDNRSCCNPGHLFVGTDADNLRDMVEKGRQSRGEHRPGSKLTEGVILVIRRSTLSQSQLAELYGVDRSVISRIQNRKVWRHIR